MAITHGGQLNAACIAYGGQPQDWLDLSTGIAPWSYPLPTVPEAIWQRLPETDDDLIKVASAYYQVATTQCLAVAGSQWAIETIPTLYSAPLRVAMLAHGYCEHPRAWQNAGHEVVMFDNLTDLCTGAINCDAAVLIQPHNPLGIVATQTQLTQLKHDLQQGILVLDEAFGDALSYPSLPLLPHTWLLRSVGKFFGLAGIRLGFVLADASNINTLAKKQSPWAVSHVARWAGKLALADTAWQSQQRQRLAEQSERLATLLTNNAFMIIGKTDLFVTTQQTDSLQRYQQSCDAQILLRHFPAFDGLRFGLPKTEGDWFRLEKWLVSLARIT